LQTAGDQPFGKITLTAIIAGRDRRLQTPAQSRKFLDAVRGLFRWATTAGLVKADPTLGVENPKRKKGQRGKTHCCEFCEAAGAIAPAQLNMNNVYSP
jgi:hypothetical protein